MYVPSHFAEDRIDLLHDAIRRTGLATLVTLTPDGLIASHIPLLLDPDPAPYGTLIGHLAKPNPQARGAIGQALVMFQGLDGYITPSWYPTKQESGKVVPTWNYVAIHAYGTLEFFDDPERLLGVVTRLTERHESARSAPWAVSDAPADFIQGMLKGIVGFALPISRLQGKVKMSQNRPEADRLGVIQGLDADGRADLAALVAAPLARPMTPVPQQFHGSCAARSGHAVLILGASGAGKSDLALRLLGRGFVLVADDQVVVQDGRASPHPSLAGLLEVRGIGIVRLPYQERVPLALVVALGDPADRLPAPALHQGLGLPTIRLDPSIPSAVDRVMLALDCALGRVTQVAGAFAP